MMRFMQWLHRWVGLIIVIQVLLWLASGLYFAIVGNTAMSGRQYLAPAASPPVLTTIDAAVDFAAIRGRYPSATAISLTQVAGQGQYQVQLPTETLYLDADNGESWRTDEALATQLALQSYSGPGTIGQVSTMSAHAELPGWQGQGFRVSMDDDLNTRIYVDGASGEILAHRNTPWLLADWAFRLHFMDYSGGRSFNHLLVWTAALLTLWFSLAGLLLLMRSLARGDFNPTAKKTWLEHFHASGQPVASRCGGGGTCGLCKVTTSGAAAPEPTGAEMAILRPDEIHAGVRLSCQHRTSDAYTVRTPDSTAKDVRLTLTSRREISPSITELAFTPGAPVNYSAGQFMEFHIPDGSEHLLRHYSMAAAPGLKQLVFTVRAMPSPAAGIPPGVGSDYLCNLAPGDTVMATGPYGDFQLTGHADATQLFIGGGAGVAPLRALIQAELSAYSPRDCVFFYGAREEDELCYRDEFESESALHYTPVLSETSAASSWQGETGWVHETAREWLAQRDTTNLDVYVCGPPPMLKATLAMLNDMGVPKSRIRFDDFGI